MPEQLRDGTALGCIGRCKVCGSAIQLRRTTVYNWPDRSITPGRTDMWAHFVSTDHAAVLNPGVCDATTFVVEVRRCDLVRCGTERSFDGTSHAAVDQKFTDAGWRGDLCPTHAELGGRR